MVDANAVADVEARHERDGARVPDQRRPLRDHPGEAVQVGVKLARGDGADEAVDLEIARRNAWTRGRTE